MDVELLYKITIADADVAQAIGVGSLFSSSSAADVVEIMDVVSLTQMDAVEMTAVAGFGSFCYFAAVEMVIPLEIAATTDADAANGSLHQADSFRLSA